MRRVLIDTGAIYAFVTRTDANHARARQFVKTFMQDKGMFVLTDIVFAETMTLLRARIGAQNAVRVGRELRLNPAYHWIALGVEGERETWVLFERYMDKEWSYTDCAIFAMAKRLHLGEIFSFDAHFSQMPGIQRKP